MYNFSKVSPISARVRNIVQQDVEARGESFILTLGTGECNDYAESVKARASICTNGVDAVRFETVARYIRTIKTKLRAKQPK